jgi:uncharacterized protein (UPF0305 family)
MYKSLHKYFKTSNNKIQTNVLVSYTLPTKELYDTILKIVNKLYDENHINENVTSRRYTINYIYTNFIRQIPT